MKRDKKFVLKTLALLLFNIFLIVLTVNILIDPWGEYRLIEHTYNRYKKEMRVTSLEPLLSKLSKKPYVLVFGTSRSAKINSQMLGEDVLNLSMEVYGKPENVYRFFQLLNNTQRSNIKKIYYLLDEHTFGNVWKEKILYANRLELELEKLININTDKIEAAIETVQFNQGITSGQLKNYTYFNAEGSQINVIGDDTRTNRHAFSKNVNLYKTIVSSSQLDYLSKLNTYLKEYNIPVFYFNTPMYFEKVSDMQKTSLGLIRRYDLYLEKIDQFHDYFYISNQFSKDEFSDNNHLNKKGMEKLVNMILQDKRTIKSGKLQEFFYKHNRTSEYIFSRMLAEGRKRFPLDTQIPALLESSSLDYDGLLLLVDLFKFNIDKYEDEKTFLTLLRVIKRINDTDKKTELSSSLFPVAIQSETMFNAMMDEKIPYESSYFDGKTRLHLIMYSLPDDRNNWINRGIKRLLQEKDEINSLDDKRTTPLHLAIKQSRHKSLQGLLLAGANPNLQDITGNTPLHYAVDMEDPFAVKTLLAFNADPLITDLSNMTVLDISATLNDLFLMDMLLPHVETPDEKSSLKLSNQAYIKGHPDTPLEIIKKLPLHPCHTQYSKIHEVLTDENKIYANVELARQMTRQCFNAKSLSLGSRLFVNDQKFRDFISDFSCQKFTLTTKSQKQIIIDTDECKILKTFRADHNLEKILSVIKSIKGIEDTPKSNSKAFKYAKRLLTFLELDYTIIN